MGHATRGGTLKPVESSRSGRARAPRSCRSTAEMFDSDRQLDPMRSRGVGSATPARERLYAPSSSRSRSTSSCSGSSISAGSPSSAMTHTWSRRRADPLCQPRKKNPTKVPIGPRDALTVSGARRTDTFRRRARGRHCLSRRGGVRPRRAVRRPPPPWPPCSSASARTWSPAWTPSYAGASP